MAGQNSLDISLTPFIIEGRAYKKLGTIAQDAGRSTVLAPFTVMAYNPTTKKWEPLTDVAATDGTQYPAGIYLGDSIAAATLVAGDVTNCQMLIGDALVDEEQLIFDGDTVAKDDIITVPTNLAICVEDLFAKSGIYLNGTVQSTGYENS